jgi:tetratricopeptide (TPR) repeat protein
MSFEIAKNLIRKCRPVFLLFAVFLPSVLKADTDPLVTNYNQGLSFFSANHFDEALSHFLQSADENFNSWQSYEMAGYCYFEMREKDWALEAFEDSLNINPQNEHLLKVYTDLKAGAADIPLKPVVDASGFLPGT